MVGMDYFSLDLIYPGGLHPLHPSLRPAYSYHHGDTMNTDLKALCAGLDKPTAPANYDEFTENPPVAPPNPDPRGSVAFSFRRGRSRRKNPDSGPRHALVLHPGGQWCVGVALDDEPL